MICTNCGNHMLEGARFCNNCGTPAYRPAPAPAPVYAPPAPAPAPVEAPVEAPVAAEPVTEIPAPPVYQAPEAPVQQPVYQQPVYQQPAAPVTPAPEVPAPTEPLSLAQYLGMEFLMFVPIVGLVFLFIWAFGKGHNVNKANWAKARLVILLVSVIVSILLVSVLFGLIAELGEMYGGFTYFRF